MYPYAYPHLKYMPMPSVFCLLISTSWIPVSYPTPDSVSRSLRTLVSGRKCKTGLADEVNGEHAIVQIEVLLSTEERGTAQSLHGFASNFIRIEMGYPGTRSPNL